MSQPSSFAAPRHELPARDGKTLSIDQLSAADGNRLGAIFAAIDPWATYGYPVSALAGFLSAQEPGAPRFALKLDAALVGAGVLRPGWLRGPYLQFLAILPGFQGRGLGSAVLDWMEREARAGNERNLWVAASEINTGALRLYERHGFTRTAKLDDLAWDGRAEILLRKRL